MICLIEYLMELIRLLDVCLVTKVRLYTLIRLCQVRIVHAMYTVDIRCHLDGK